MAQPIKKCRRKKAEIKLIGLEYCNECPFLGYNENGYICNPNDYDMRAGKPTISMVG